MAEETDIQASESTPKKKSKLLPIVIVLVLAIGGGGAWFFMRQKKAQAASAKSSGADQAKSEVKAVMHLESFVVNLADKDQSTFLRIGVDLGMAKDLASGKEEKGSPVAPRVRDAILTIVTAWQSADLLAPDGKTKLKEQILHALHERVPELEVREVYITDFLVQR